jgi:acyl carrier protein
VRAVLRAALLVLLVRVIAVSGSDILVMTGAVPEIERTMRRGPLSYAQERLWALARRDPHSVAYTVPLALRLRGALDAGALSAALDALVARHEILRTRFTDDGGGPLQIVDERTAPTLALVDLRGIADEPRERHLSDALAAVVRTPFDLVRGPLARVVLHRLGEREHVLLVAMHHIITDGWSLNAFVRELSSRYNELRRGAASAPKPPSTTYLDHALAQREAFSQAELERQVGYWRERLAGIRALALPADRLRPARPSQRGAHLDFAVPAPLTAALRALAEREGTTLFTVLLAAYHVWLSAVAGQSDTVVGVPVAGRTDPRTHDVLGFFVNVLPLRADLADDPRFTELLNTVGAGTRAAYAHQDVPFDKLVEGVRAPREPGRHPLFQTILNYRTYDVTGAGWDGLEALPYPRPWTGSTQVDLTLLVEKDGAALQVRAEYALDLFEPATVAGWANDLLALLAEIARDPARRVSQLAPGVTAGVREAREKREETTHARAHEAPTPARADEPLTETQASLRELWAALLRVDEIGLDDEFYDLGGHSGLAFKVLDRVTVSFGVEVPVEALFEELTVRRLAERIDALRAVPVG